MISPPHLMRSRLPLASVICLAVLSTLGAHAQGWAPPNPVSPTATSLGRFEEVPVGAYTGAFSYNIPIHVVRGHSTELPIALNYHGGGVRVGNVPGPAGVGWTLSAGGAVSRTIRGLPDESPNGYLATGHELWSLEPNGTLTSSFLISLADRTIDPEPDLFYFSAGTSSGRFARVPTEKIADFDGERVVTVPRQPIDILAPNDPGNSGNRWVITDPSGVKYIYAEIERTVGRTFDTINGDIASWYLTEIVSPSGHSDIRIRYSPPVSVTTYGARYEERFYADDNYNAFNCTVPTAIDSATPNQSRMPLVTSISSAQDSVVFEYSTHTIPQLDKVRVFSPGGSEIFHTAFAYETYGTQRHFLTSVQPVSADGVTTMSPFQFSYESPASLPAFSSDKIDHWGFYNAQGNTNLLPSVTHANPFAQDPSYRIPRVLGDGANREPSSTFSQQSGVLRTITFPTGGTLTVDYEANEYNKVSGGSGSAGYTQTRTVSARAAAEPFPTTAQDVPFTVVQEVPPPAGEPLTPVLSVEVTLRPTCSGSGSCQRTIEVVGPQGRVGFWATTNTTAPVTYSIAVDPGEYTLKARSNNETDEFEAIGRVTWTDRYAAPPAGTTTTPQHAGGLRVKKTTLASGDGSPSIVRNYSYIMEDDTTSSGVLTVAPWYINQYEFVLRGEIVQDTGAMRPDCPQVSVSSTSSIPLGMTQGGVVGYRRVVETTENGTGRTVSTFRTAQDAPNSPQGGPVTASTFGTQTDQDWQRGQLTSRTVYDENGDVISVETNTHIVVANEQGQNTLILRALNVKSVNAANTGCFNGVCPTMIMGALHYYEIVSGAYLPTESIITRQE